VSPFLAKIVVGVISFVMLALCRTPLNVLIFYILYRPVVQPFAFLGYTIVGSIPLTSVFAIAMIVIGFGQACVSKGSTLFPPNSVPLYSISFLGICSLIYTVSFVDTVSSIFKFLLALSVWLIAYNSIRSMCDFKKILYAFAYSSIIPSIYGYYQYFTNTGHAWKSDYYAGSRIDSFLGEYNAYGEFLCLSIFGALTALILENKKRLFLVAVIANSLCSLILSLNRGSWLAITFSLAFASIVALKAKSLKYMVIIGVVVSIAFGSVILQRFEELNTRSEYGEKNTLTGRVAGWIALVPLIEKQVFFGYGAGTSTKVFEMYFGKSQDPHNDYIRIWCELGIFALLFYLFFLSKEVFVNFIRSLSPPFYKFPVFACSIYMFVMSITQNIYINVTIFPMAMTLFAAMHKLNVCKFFIKASCDRVD
jgi:O-antigen ligase